MEFSGAFDDASKRNPAFACIKYNETVGLGEESQ